MAEQNTLRGLLGYGRDVAQGASNSIAGNVSAPVDGLAWLLRKAGVPMPSNPVGGSDWMRQKGLTAEPQNRMAGLLGDFIGMAGPMVAAAKAPQVAAGLLGMADNAMLPNSMNKQAGAVVWHGSPHKFDKFDASKIGTGEGAQVYGNGLYLADEPKVAKMYQKQLSENKMLVGGNEIELTKGGFYDSASVGKNLGIDPKAASMAMQDKIGDISLLNNLRSQKGNYPKTSSQDVFGDVISDSQAVASRQELASLFKQARSAKNQTEFKIGGNLYKVDLPDEHIAKMLDWDKGGEQYWHKAVNKFGSPQAASDALKSQGIPGIRYLDGGSRATGGTSNYVVFPGNEGLLSILERNGMKP